MLPSNPEDGIHSQKWGLEALPGQRRANTLNLDPHKMEALQLLIDSRILACYLPFLPTMPQLTSKGLNPAEL